MPYRCEHCKADPHLMFDRGCDDPTLAAVWDDGEDEYYNCPLKFVPDNIMQWFDEYTYRELTSCWPAWEDVGSRFYNAMLYFRGAVADFSAEKKQPGIKGLTNG